MSDFEYDIAVSYASEDQPLVSKLVASLESKGAKVFFAPSIFAKLIGERMAKFLPSTYGNKSRFVVVVLSESYLEKTWTRFELEAAEKEEQQRENTFILPVRVDDVEFEGLSPDRVFADLRERSLDRVSADLVERVRMHRGEISANEAFSNAFREWKQHGFIPGNEKGVLFLEHLDEITLDAERCEFLLRCPWGHNPETRKRILRIAPELRVAAGERLLRSAKTPGSRLSAIAYIGSADPMLAEKRLRQIYEDESVAINDRARAFSELWKCGSRQVTADSHALLLNREAPWQMRKAAAINVLWGPPSAQTKEVLSRAVRDPRQEVRVPVVEAIMRFELEDLAPALMEVYGKDKSRKSRGRIKEALRLFNDRQDVIEFGREMGFGPAFFKPPPYIHDWEENREGWL